MKNSLLLIVDVQNGFINQHTRHLVAPIVQLVTDWQAIGGRVVYSRFVNIDNSPWERLLNWSKLKHEPQTALHPDLPINNADVFKKSTYSAWGPDLDQLCRGFNIETVLLCGIDTDQCVLKTAVDIFEANLTPLVLEDLCASSAGGQFHEAGLLVLGRMIGVQHIKSAKEVL